MLMHGHYQQVCGPSALAALKFGSSIRCKRMMHHPAIKCILHLQRTGGAVGVCFPIMSFSGPIGVQSCQEIIVLLKPALQSRWDGGGRLGTCEDISVFLDAALEQRCLPVFHHAVG